MAELNEKAKKVFALKYSTGKSKSWKETCRKIADFMADGERAYGKSDEEVKEVADRFFEYLYELYMLPGGRIIANAGTGIKNLANCFVLGIDDSRQSIYQTLKDAAEVFAMGGGVGYNFSHIREEGADIGSTGGKASGPLSFMSLFDQTGEVIQQASRRGAQLGALNISHPDIEKFIGFKSTLNSRNDRLMQEYDRNLHVVNGMLNGTKYEKILEKTLLDDQLTHFNISVMLTDAFMQAVEEDKPWDLVSPSTGEVVKTVQAKDLLMQMATQAWESGDPGVLFYDAINRDNLVPYMGDIEATNPCFHPDTMIETVNGRTPIKDITEGTLVYSMDSDGQLCLRRSSSSWVSRQNTNTLKVLLNNGRELIVTPDHKIMSKQRGWVEARELRAGEEVVTLCRARRGSAYSGIKLSTESNRSYRMEHRWLWDNTTAVPNDNNYDIHHVNGNTYDNRLDNFELLTRNDHATLTRYSCDNNHQVRGKSGQFISSGKHGKKTIIQMPYDLRSDFPGKPRVVSVEQGPITDVYDISVEGTNCLIADYVVAHNCGEVPLLSGESCILTSINLHEMYDKKNKEIDWKLLQSVVETATRFLDDVTEVTEAPLEFINTKTKGLRRLGLGVMGWADLLVELNIPYDSEDAVHLAHDMSWFINYHAWETSFKLAEERGSFHFYDENKVNRHVFDKLSVPLSSHYGVRNVAVTSIAPTGSIAIIGGVNSSIEPFFALAYKRNITEGVGNIATDSIFETNPALQRKLKEFGYEDEEVKRQILDYASEHGTLTGCDLVSEEFQSIFKTANEIAWKDHIKMQAAWQEFFSNAISKTINIPEDATVEDIYNIYMYMWKAGLKGGTIYRNNSKSFQILEKPAKKE